VLKKELPEGWKWKILGEIGDIFSGSTPSTSDSENFEGNIPWITPADLSNYSSMYIERGKRDISEKGLNNSSATLLPKGAILFSSRAPVGYVAIAAKPLATNQGFKNLVLKCDDILPEYVYYYLRANTKLVEKYASGTTFLEVSASRFAQIPISIPPLDTQRKIVAILEKAEATQRLRAEADALTRSLSESAFINLFGNPLENPFGWKVKRLEDVSEIVSGVTKGRKFKDQVTIWVPYLRVANVQDGYLDLAEIKEIEVLESDVDKYALNPGDVLLTEGGDRDKLGRGAVWNGEAPLCLHQNHIFRVRVNPELLIPEYLSMLTGSTYGKMYFLKSAKQTTGIASINSTQLKNFPTYLPPLELQYEFSEFVKRVEELKRKQSGSKQRITMLFESLTNNVFSGEMTA
jgi:type I restriction enzyme S subunit